MRKEYATVIAPCEVSFQVGKADYGTINVPVGTRCFRWAGDPSKLLKASEWFVIDPQGLCPESHKINGEPCHGFMHDFENYGITMPNANVRKDGEEMPKAKYNAFHY